MGDDGEPDSVYKPNQRQIRVDVLAVGGWVSGTLHVAAKSSLVATLNKKTEFVPLTGVTSDPTAPAADFLALRRQAIMLVVPNPEDAEQHGAGQPGSFGRWPLRLMLEKATVEGSVHVLAGLRVSDFLETNTGFVILDDCSVSSEDYGREPAIGQVILNMSHVHAVAELARRDAPEAVKRPMPELVGAASSGRAR